ncbi:hypothetical protein Trydic_g13740 [Trypoxylus dichotomus]
MANAHEEEDRVSEDDDPPIKIKNTTKPLTVLNALLIWLVAVILSIPDGMFTNVTEMYAPNNTRFITVCTPFPNSTTTSMYVKYNVAGKALIFYLCPLTIIATYYILMAKKLHESAKEMPGEMQGQSVAQVKARRQVARLVLCFVFLFFICFFPYHVFALWFFFNPNMESEYDDFWHALKIIAFCLSFLNSCVNPIALYCVSGVFRQYFNKYLFCQDSRRLRRNTPSSMGNCDTSLTSTFRRHTQSTLLTKQKSSNNAPVALDSLGSRKDNETNARALVILRGEKDKDRCGFGS